MSAAGGPVFLAVDVGTGSARAALVDAGGTVLALAARDHPHHVPGPGRAEQDPAEWWAGVAAATREVLETAGANARGRLSAAAVCGQMHGPVPIGADGAVLTDRVQLWNDKRGAALAEAIARRAAPDLAARAGNAPDAAWMGVKIAWLKEEAPDLYARAAVFLTPKDFVAWRLAGVAATDPSEASGAWALAAATGDWDDDLIEALGIDRAKLPPVRPAAAPIGGVTAGAAAATGLPQGLPVVAGAGDFPAALLGAGVVAPGRGCDVGGTSNIVAAIAEAPVAAAGVANLSSAGAGWIAFSILDAGGDAMRWARRCFGDAEGPGARDWAAIEAEVAEIPAGAEGLVFLPYLTGERGPGGATMRGQFLGLGTHHGRGHLYRAVMEGVALASRADLARLRLGGARPDRLTAIGGGAKSAVWPAIKAAAYGLPLDVPETAEGGLIGCAALAGIGAGVWPDAAAATADLVRIERTIDPDPALVRTYARLATVFDEAHETARRHCARLAAM